MYKLKLVLLTPVFHARTYPRNDWSASVSLAPRARATPLAYRGEWYSTVSDSDLVNIDYKLSRCDQPIRISTATSRERSLGDRYINGIGRSLPVAVLTHFKIRKGTAFPHITAAEPRIMKYCDYLFTVTCYLRQE